MSANERIRAAQRENDRAVRAYILAHNRRQDAPSMNGGVSLAWLNALDRLRARGAVRYARSRSYGGGYVVRGFGLRAGRAVRVSR